MLRRGSKSTKPADEAPVEASVEPQPAGVLVRRPRTSIYTVLLGIALVAIGLGCLLMVLEISQYDMLWNRPWSQSVR